MSERYRIAVLGLTHDHIWDNLPDVRRHGQASLVAAADPHQVLLGRIESEYQARPYSHCDTLLDSEQLDAVYLYGDNAASVELTEKAAARGLHVLVEKPMAADLSGARRMLAAAGAAGVRLMINWPFAWWPQLQHALRLAGDGEIGEVWQVRYRAAHAGPRELGCSEFFCDWLFDPARNGPGGAYADYCCYGALLARLLLGMPAQVAAVGGCLRKPEIAVDDNAILVMKYPQALAVSEASWTQVGKLSSYLTVIYGSTGTMVVEPRVGGRLLLASHDCPEGRAIEVPDPRPSQSTATDHFLACLASGDAFDPLCDAQLACDTQAILEAGGHSLRSGAVVDL